MAVEDAVATIVTANLYPLIRDEQPKCASYDFLIPDFRVVPLDEASAYERIGNQAQIDTALSGISNI